MIKQNPKKTKSFLKASLLIGLTFCLVSCGNYSKAITIDKATTILENAVSYLSSPHVDSSSYGVKATITEKLDDDSLDKETFLTSEISISYFLPLSSVSSGDLSSYQLSYTKKLNYADETQENQDTSYLVTYTSDDVMQVSKDGGDPADYETEDAFLKTYLSLPDYIRQDGLFCATHSFSLLSSIGTIDQKIPNTLTGYQALSSGGSDLDISFTGSELGFDSLFSDLDSNTASAYYFSAHFASSQVTSLTARYSFAVSSDTDTNYPVGSYEGNIVVDFS